MGKVKILAVALASLASTTFAGGDLWSFEGLLTTPNCGDYCSQVKTPGAIFCWGDADRPSSTNSYYSPCYSKSGGWWFGYADGDGWVEDGVVGTKIFKAREDSCTTPNDPTPAQAVGTVVIERWINGTDTADQNSAWTSGNLTVPAIPTPFKAGHYFIKGYGMGNADEGLDVKFINPGGTDENPNVSAIGFNWRAKKECGGDDYEGFYTENLKLKGSATGLCIRYKADKAGVDVELGWNEASLGYNTYIAKLSAATSWKTLNIKWDAFRSSYDDGDEPEPLETAITQAEALKFALKTKTATPETIRFQLSEVGWYNTCSGTAEEFQPGQTPIIGGKIASAYKFNLKDRILTANFAGAVQVINLQGKVVAKKTLAANESLSLAGLPAGIYMVRSENRGIVQKVILK